MVICHWRNKEMKEEVKNGKLNLSYCDTKLKDGIKCDGIFKNEQRAKEFCKYFINSETGCFQE